MGIIIWHMAFLLQSLHYHLCQETKLIICDPVIAVKCLWNERSCMFGCCTTMLWYHVAVHQLHYHPSSSSSHLAAPDVVLSCPRAGVRRPSEPTMFGHYSGVLRPHLPGLHSVIAPVRSVTGQLASWLFVLCRYVWSFAFSALTLLVNQQEGHLACKNVSLYMLAMMIWLELEHYDFHTFCPVQAPGL